MADCKYCKEGMSEADTCSWNEVVEYPDGTKMPSLTYHRNEPSGRCHDCGIKHGGKHHPGCDIEKCPRCEGQLIGCGCFDDPDPDEGS